MRPTMGALLCASFLLSSATAADPGFGKVSRPDGHAPISVMGDHMHKKGEWMLSYRYMFMDMDGNRDGTRRVSDDAVLADYPVTPRKMDMEMHMVGVMYGLTDRVTLMAMMPFARLDMDHRTRMGARFNTRSIGIGDLKLSAMVGLFKSSSERWTHALGANAGISVPTGNFHNRDDTPAGNVRLPYPMQIGSGTVDLLPGLTYTTTYGDWSGGGQITGVIRLGRNSRDYRRGHAMTIQGWGARRLSRWVSTSFRAAFVREGNYGGSDGALNPNVVPTADPSLRWFRRVDLGLGLNFIVPKGPLAGHRLAVEAVRPVWQKVAGPQLETDWMITAGWQLAFGGH